MSDLANVHVDALQLIERGDASLIVNLGTGRAHSILEVVSGIEKLTGRTVPVINAPRRSGDPPTLVADPSLAQKRLRFKPRYSDLETIIQTTWRSRNA